MGLFFFVAYKSSQNEEVLKDKKIFRFVTFDVQRDLTKSIPYFCLRRGGAKDTDAESICSRRSTRSRSSRRYESDCKSPSS